ncbi:hypothetical protein Vafri_14452 [Volvox africanus]|uniref:Uncharacterized protein n=1 Tax=Volvox africanus TaxID=51714 RepID=A0A8J4BDI6_9CHLO|nr:hypothetical protein Vafri_14452 [Volvox africanus]
MILLPCGKSYSFLCFERRQSAAEECDQYQHNQNPQHLGPRTHGIGRGVTARGARSDHTGAGSGSWSNSGRNGTLGRGASASGVNTLRHSKYVLVKHNSVRGCGRGGGRMPGRGYYSSGRMERRVSEIHAPNHSYGRGQESYEGYDDDDNDRGYEHHGYLGNDDGEAADDFGDEEGQYSAEEEAVEKEEQERHNADGAMGAADGLGSYGGQRRHQYQQQYSSATTYRQAWNFQDRIRQIIVDAQRKDLPLPLPAQFLPSKSSADAEAARARPQTVAAAVAELQEREARLAAVAREKKAQVTKGEDLMRRLKQVYSELTAEAPLAAAAAAACASVGPGYSFPPEHHAQQQARVAPPQQQHQHQQPPLSHHHHRQNSEFAGQQHQPLQAFATHMQVSAPGPPGDASPIPLHMPTTTAPQQQQQPSGTAAALRPQQAYMNQHELPGGGYPKQPRQISQCYDVPRGPYDTAQRPQSQAGDGTSGGSAWPAEQPAIFGYDPRGMPYRLRDHDHSPSRGAWEREREREQEANRDGRGRGRSWDQRGEYYYSTENRDRTRHQSHDRRGRSHSRSRSREWRDSRESRRRSRSRSRGRSGDQSRDRHVGYSHGRQSYSPAQDRWPEKRPPMQDTPYGGAARHIAPSSASGFPPEWSGDGYAAAGSSYGVPPPAPSPSPSGPVATQEPYRDVYVQPKLPEQRSMPPPPAAPPAADYYSFSGRASAAVPRASQPVQQQQTVNINTATEWDRYDRRYDGPGEPPRSARPRTDAREAEYRRRDPMLSPEVRDRDRGRERQPGRARDFDRERDRERNHERERERALARERGRERERDRAVSGGSGPDSLRRPDRVVAPRREDSRSTDIRRENSRTSEDSRRTQDGGQKAAFERGVSTGAPLDRTPQGLRDPRQRPVSPEIGRGNELERESTRLQGEKSDLPCGQEGSVAADANAHTHAAMAELSQVVPVGSVQVEPCGHEGGTRADEPTGEVSSGSAGDVDDCKRLEHGGHRGGSHGAAAEDTNGDIRGSADVAQDNEAYEEEMVDYDLPDELDID